MQSVILLTFALLFSFCQLSATQACFEYLGCHGAEDEDTYDTPDFPHGQMYNSAVTPLSCLSFCQNAFGDAIAGIRNGKVCRCGSSFASNASTSCSPCSADPNSMCGASDATSIYTYAACSDSSQPITPVAPVAPVPTNPPTIHIPVKRDVEASPNTGFGAAAVSATTGLTTGTGFGTSTTSNQSTTAGLTTGGATTGATTVTQIVAHQQMSGDYTSFNVTLYCLQIAAGINVSFHNVDCAKALSRKRAAENFTVTITVTVPEGSSLLGSSGNSSNATSFTDTLVQALTTTLNSSAIQSYLSSTGTTAQPPTIEVVTIVTTTGGGGGGGSSNKVALGVGLGLGLGLGLPLIVLVAYLIAKNRGMQMGAMNPVVAPPHAEARV